MEWIYLNIAIVASRISIVSAEKMFILKHCFCCEQDSSFVTHFFLSFLHFKMTGVTAETAAANYFAK